MAIPTLDARDMQAIAVLATATTQTMGAEAPVTLRLRELLREPSQEGYRAAQEAFDALGPELRRRIANAAPILARRRVRHANLPGLLAALQRAAHR
jgi:hypothetical protein